MEQKEFFSRILEQAVEQVVGGVYPVPRRTPCVESLLESEGILSSIYLKGGIIGRISLFIQEPLAAKVVAVMLDVPEMDSGDDETLDGVGEILNMITGCFKKALEPHKFSFEISVPSTRITSIVLAGRWENGIDQFYDAAGVIFRVLFSYRVPVKEEIAATLQVPGKPKISAADLLRRAMARKTDSSGAGGGNEKNTGG